MAFEDFNDFLLHSHIFLLGILLIFYFLEKN